MGKKKDTLTRKIILLGDSYTGKSSILKNISEYSEDYITEQIGANKFEIKTCIDQVGLRLIVWDGVVSGYKTDYRSIVYKDTDMVIICYSVDSNLTFSNVEKKWIPELNEYCPNIPYILLANKIDLRQNKTVMERLKSWDEHLITKDEGICIAQRTCCRSFLECSGTSKTGLDDLVKLTVETITHKYKKKSKECTIL